MEGLPLTLDLAEEIQSLLDQTPALLSEYNFPNLFLFREKHRYRYFPNERVIEGVSYQGDPFYLPLQYPLQIGKLTELLLKKNGAYLFPIPDEECGRFNLEIFDKRENRDEQDYLYRRNLLSDFCGNGKSGQRNLVYQFEKEYPFFEVVSLEKEEHILALKLLEEWERAHPEGDAKNCREALQLMEGLGLEGILIKEGKFALAFAIFSALNPDTLVVHFAKSLSRYKGGFSFLIQRVAKATSYPWVSLEQDLGLSGLRRAKTELHPDQMRKKWHLFLKGQ